MAGALGARGSTFGNGTTEVGGIAMWGCVKHVKDFNLLSKSNGKPLGFKMEVRFRGI